MAIKHMDTALPPPEVKRIIRKFHLCQKDIDGWFAVPTLNPPPNRLSLETFLQEGQVDAVGVILPLLGNKILTRSIRKIDLVTGCGRGCHTCLADSSLPSRYFSYHSLQRLFHLKSFLNTLAKDRLRLGNTSDPSDHPQLVKIVKLILRQTKFLDRRMRNNSHGHERHRVTVFTNYRPNNESQLNELLDLATKNQRRLSVVISLPLNKTDTVNDRFIKYARSRRNIFIKPKGHEVNARFKNIHIQDVRHETIIFTTGRRLSKPVLMAKRDTGCVVESDRNLDYRHRGFVEIYFNPDALWLMAYSTIHESHTVRSYTPLNSINLEVFSLLPYHPNCLVPPNWPGKTRPERQHEVADKIKKTDRTPKKRVTIVR